MAFRVYVLYSRSLERHYVGFSAHHLRRLCQHRRGRSNWSSRATDWIEVWTQEMPDRKSARTLESRIKGRGARRFLAELDAEALPGDDALVRTRV